VWTNICLDTYVSSTTFLLERISKSRKKSRCCKDLCASSVRHRIRQANRGTTAVVVGLKEVIDTGHAAIRGGVNIPALTWWCGCQRRRQCRRLSPWRPHARRWGQGLEERREQPTTPRPPPVPPGTYLTVPSTSSDPSACTHRRRVPSDPPFPGKGLGQRPDAPTSTCARRRRPSPALAAATAKTRKC
jgi:hypothetical protein